MAEKDLKEGTETNQSPIDKNQKTMDDFWSPPLPIGRQRFGPKVEVDLEELYAGQQENAETVSESIMIYERYQSARAEDQKRF